ncbi:MAG TPA: protein kinase, partial [Ktedonobacteraceae bacterium]|nr:protein kinase [Ktedonobacteraceae bacterium]
QRGHAKILDFGLAKVTTQHRSISEIDGSTVTAPDEQLTSPGGMIGTVAYMSPEQVRAQELDARTDLFSFGAVLYEMATGKMPFQGESSGEICSEILKSQPKSPSELNPALPPELEDIIQRALEKDHNLRYQHASDMGADLKRLKRDSDSNRLGSSTGRALGRRHYLRSWAVGAMAVAVLVALAVGYFFSRSSAKLTSKDSVVLADFTNTTGDSVFDRTLQQGLWVHLEQSPFLNLVSYKRIGQTLALMTKPKDTRLTPELAREVCQRTGSAATIEGSIANLGSQYVIGLMAVNCVNGDVLAQEQVAAEGKEQVMKALGTAATGLRKKLGESLRSVEKYDAPIDGVTTSSLEALQAFTMGSHALSVENNFAAAIPLFQRAISLDPTFALAYVGLGSGYYDMGDTARTAEALGKAYQLRERVSEREKLRIESEYQHLARGDLEAARKAYELWAQTYPRDDIPYARLAIIYAQRGEHEKALEENRAAQELSPGSGMTYGNLVYSYLLLDRLQEAKQTAQLAGARNLDSPLVHENLYLAEFIAHDEAGMQTEAARLLKNPEWKSQILYDQADSAAYYGRFARAR